MIDLVIHFHFISELSITWILPRLLLRVCETRAAIIQSAHFSLFKSAIGLAHSLATAATGTDEKASMEDSSRAIPGKRPQIPLSTCGQSFTDFKSLMAATVSDFESVTESDLRRLFDLFDVDNDGKLSQVESDALNRTIIEEVNALKCALIVVDFQNDFVNGSLAIKKGPARQDPHEALVPLNRLLRESKFDLVVYTQDWHPPNHISFYEHCRNGDRALRPEDKSRKLRPFDTVTFDSPQCLQVLYPAHCLQNSWGAELSPHLARVPTAKFVRKGLNVFVDAYSAFSDNNGENKSELAMMLRAEGVDGVFICGLAYEICVAATTKEASDLGFFAALVADCSKGLDSEKIDKTNVELSERNVAIVNADAADSFAASQKVPWRWVCQLAGISGNQAVSEVEPLKIANGSIAASANGIAT